MPNHGREYPDSAENRLEPQSRELLKTLTERNEQLGDNPSPEHRRSTFRRFPLNAKPIAQDVNLVTEIAVAANSLNIPCRLYHPKPSKMLPCLVWFHGGGHVVGDLDTHDSLCRLFANEMQIAVLNVDYRLAPEHPFPAAFDDAMAAVNWIKEIGAYRNLDCNQILVGGSSAGGNLSASICLALRGQKGLRIVHQLLVYPPVDATLSNETYQTFSAGYSYTTKKRIWSRDKYVGDFPDLEDPRLSPIFASSHEGLPPTLIITAELDPLRGEAEDYACKLLKSGVPVSIKRYNGVMHGFFSQSGRLDVGKAAIRDACTAMLRSLADQV